MTSGHGPRGPGDKPGTFLKLELRRKVSTDPRKLEDFPLCKHEGYRIQYAYVVFISRKVVKKKNGELKEEWEPIDARVVKTLSTLNKIANEIQKKKGIRVLLHPQPVKIPKGFWKKWRKAKKGWDRKELAKGLTKDENVFVLVCIVLDWDSPYEECEPVFLELVERLGIKGYECGRTKSGNFRAVIYLEPLRIEKKDQPIRTFYLTAQGKGRNGHTHARNFREIVAILNAYAQRKGIKADNSFKRVNKPVWYGESFYKRERKVHGETKLYNLYNAVKKLQAEEGLWETNREFWKTEKPKKTGGKVILPPFVVRIQTKRLDDLYRWQIAVRRLSEKYTTQRFTRVILPAVRWAMDLGLSRWDVDSYLKELLPDKRDMDAELERAWKYARPQRFEWYGKGGKIDLKEKLVEFLENTEEGAPRQFLLSEVFGGQNWLLQIVERFAIREGLISVEKRKLTQGRGRKSYIYALTEKGKSFVEALRDNAQSIQLSLAVGFDLPTHKKSIYKTPPHSFRGEQVSRRDTGLAVDGSTLFCLPKAGGSSSLPRAPMQTDGNAPSQSQEGEEGKKERPEGDKKEEKVRETGTPPTLSPATERDREGKTKDPHRDLTENLPGGYIFSDKNEAIKFLESLNGRFRIGDRVKVWVVSPARMHEGKPVLYEFEKVLVDVYRGFEKVGERETWEVKKIYWESVRKNE